MPTGIGNQLFFPLCFIWVYFFPLLSSLSNKIQLTEFPDSNQTIPLGLGFKIKHVMYKNLKTPAVECLEGSWPDYRGVNCRL